MRIAISLFLTSPKSVTGAFVYIQQILPRLFKMAPDNTYYLIGEKESIEHFKKLYGNLPNVKLYLVSFKRDLFFNPLRAIKKAVAKLKKDNSMRERVISNEVNYYLRKNKIDIYFSPAQTIYPSDLSSVKFITTILDIQFEYFPENFPADYLAQRKKNIMYAIKKSNILISISNYTKKTLMEKYGVDENSIIVTHFAAQEIPEEEGALTAPEEFVFYPAALWPHKNHRILLKSLSLLKDKFPRLSLVCTGINKGKTLRKELEMFAETEGIKDRVYFYGFVPEKELFSLYKKAKMLVFPSSFEGFGIPLIEAFNVGLPVIAANNSSITEVVENAGILVPTGDSISLAHAIEKVLTDDNLRNDLIKKGLQRGKLFSWDKTTQETLAVFDSAQILVHSD